MSAVSASATEIPAAARSTVGYLRVTSLAFWGVHVAALIGVIALGWSWSGAALALGSYFVRMFVVTAGYHRYFSHRAFKTSRAFQFLLALGAQSAAQKGVLWWASHHRWHHKYSDTPKDVHSAKLRGFWYSHIGWIMGKGWDQTDHSMVADLAKFPELRALDRSIVHILPTVALALAFLFLGGGHALVWGYFVSTVLLWHGSFSINSLAHLFGKRRYATVGRLAQQLGARAAHDRRGLAQQPPPLSELGQSGLPLVGDRRDLLRPAPARALGADLGSARVRSREVIADSADAAA